MLALNTRKSISVRKRKQSSSDDDSDEEVVEKIPVPSKFRASSTKISKGDLEDIFIIDTAPVEETSSAEKETEPLHQPSSVIADPALAKLLSKAKGGLAAEKVYASESFALSKKAAKRLKKAEAEKTAGDKWFGLPASEHTEAAKADLELLQMRNAIDPTAHYRRNDRSTLPKYFQIGRVVDAPEDYYSGRMTRKERKKTIVDELLNDMEFQKKNKEKFSIIKAREAKVVRGAFQHGGPRRKKEKKDKKSKKK